MEPSFVTILSCDLPAPDARRYLVTVRASIADHGGREVKPAGAGLLATFTSPVAAVRCAVTMQIDAEAAGHGLCVGLDAGEPLADGDNLYGEPISVAGRLCDAARPGEILATELVRQLVVRQREIRVHPRGSVRLKGVAETVAIATVAWRAEPDEAAERILAAPDHHTAVVMLTTFDLNEYVYEALRIGASGFLLKDAPADRLLDAIRAAARGDALLAPSITRRLIGHFAGAARPSPGGLPDELAGLTERELEVFRMMARGMSNAELAAELVLTENTVKTHVARVLGKLGLRARVQAVVLAYETGFVTREG